MAGRKRIGKQVRVHAPDQVHVYLARLCKELGISSVSEAGRVVLIEAERVGLVLPSRSATVATEPRDLAA